MRSVRMTVSRDFNKWPRRVCCEPGKILAPPGRWAGTNRHILLQQYRPGLRATKKANSRLDAESVREGRKKSSLSPFIPMHDHAYGRTDELLTTGGCIADVSDGNVSQVTAHTHTRAGSLHDPIVPRRSARPGINLSYLWAEGPGLSSRDAGRVWHLCSRRADGVNVRKRCEKGGGRGKGPVALQAKRKGEVDTDALKGGYERGGVRPVSICR